ncbi:MAG: M23 family metallopeptidase, partial [Fidelibacterota bacterium]
MKREESIIEKADCYSFSSKLLRGCIFILIFLFSAKYTFSQPGYQWPAYPFNQQHRISGTFCENRADRDHFHSAVDIPLAYGGTVYSVSDGRVLDIDPSGGNSYIRVERYAYVHVTPNPALEVGDYVGKGDPIGSTNTQNHIHFKDGGGLSGTKVINPLREGGLNPFEDPYKPNKSEIKFYRNGTTTRFSENVISGRVDIVAHASDVTDLLSWVDMNNGLYRIGYQIFEADARTPVTSAIYPFQFDELPDNA